MGTSDWPEGAHAEGLRPGPGRARLRTDPSTDQGSRARLARHRLEAETGGSPILTFATRPFGRIGRFADAYSHNFRVRARIGKVSGKRVHTRPNAAGGL